MFPREPHFFSRREFIASAGLWGALSRCRFSFASTGEGWEHLPDEMGENDAPLSERVFGEGNWLRPSFIQFCRCRNVLVEGIDVTNAPMWQIHPVLCTNVTVRCVTMASHGPNNDGCNPESCRDVLIDGCVFDTGDDCIAIKSGRNRDGRRLGVAYESIVIRNCRMKDVHGGVTIGSEASGGVRAMSSRKNAAWTARGSIAPCGSRRTPSAAVSLRTSSCAT